MTYYNYLFEHKNIELRCLQQYAEERRKDENNNNHDVIHKWG